MNQIKTVIFDFDGTIADSLSTVIDIFNVLAKENDLPQIFPDDIEELRNHTLKELVVKSGISKIKMFFLVRKWKSLMSAKINTLNTFQGIKGLLKTLRVNGYQLGIVTSNSKQNVEDFVKLNNLDYFDFIYSESNLFGKGRTLKKCLKKYNLTPEQVIYVGDDSRDIDAARESGIKIISVSWGYNSKELLLKNKPTFLIDEPRKLLKILS